VGNIFLHVNKKWVKSPLFLLGLNREMSIAQHIEGIIAPALVDKGFGIVRVHLQDSKRKLLQIMIERIDGTALSVDDCALASHTVSVLLDVDDPIHEPYTLEVSSPGLDRPLTKKADFERFSGSMVKIELKSLHEGRRRFQGVLQGIEGDLVRVAIPLSKEDNTFDVVEFAFYDIQKAKLLPDYET
jgi:ribosome maturation factor RimP